MSVATLVLGDSGAGKTASLRTLDPARTLLIQAQAKPLPFRADGWAPWVEGRGNIIATDHSADIVQILARTRRDVIVLDDFQYLLANEFMRRSHEVGFTKFTEIGRHAWDVLSAAMTLAAHQRVYVLGHTQSDDFGRVRAKTIGRMLDEKVVIEGLFTIVLRALVQNDAHVFATRNSGSDTVKTPIGLFDTAVIPNDLAAVDAAIVRYYAL